MRHCAKAIAAAAALVAFFILIQPSGLCATLRQSGGHTRVLCFTTYDADFFYLAAVVDKPNVVGKEEPPFGNPLESDAIAVFLDADTAANGHRSARSIEMAVSAAGGVQVYRGADAVPFRGLQDFVQYAGKTGHPPFKYRATVRGKLNVSGAPDNGYTVELAIPWAELGGPPAIGQRMRFNVVSYSAGAGSASIVSMSPLVKTPADVQNPALWGEIIFVDAPVKSVASAPTAKVSARVFSNKPLIDGVVSDGEWNSLTAFGFSEAAGGGSSNYAPTLGTSRIRPKVTLHPAPPTVAIHPRDVGTLPPRTAQPVPRLVMTLYSYELQGDPRKAAPYAAPRKDDGSTLLTSHPMDGEGPWMTYDRVDWHRRNLAQMRENGVDVVLPVYRGDATSKQRYALRGLMTMTEALAGLRRAGKDYPLVGMYLDTSSLSNSEGGKLDLRAEDSQTQLYTMIREFFQQVPPVFRATVPLSAQNGGGRACLVVLSSAAPFADMDQSFVDSCRRRFLSEFGEDLVIIGSADFKPKAKLDAYVDDSRGRGPVVDDGGWIRAASVGTQAAPPEKSPGTTAVNTPPRDDVYRSEWAQALAKGADWVIIDGWTDFQGGTEIAPTLERGVELSDMTRISTRRFGAIRTLNATFLASDLPREEPSGVSVAVAVRVVNAGAVTWTPETHSIAYHWDQSGLWQQVPLPGSVIPGQAVDIPLTVTMPTTAGPHTLVVDIMEKEKRRGKEDAPPYGGAPLHAVVHIAPRNDGASLPAYGASLVNSELPNTLEAGGTYIATVTLRNDGTTTWKQSDGARVTARLSRYTSPINATAEQESEVDVALADATAKLPTDVPAGQTVTLTVPITFSQADGATLPSWSQSDNWLYRLRWEVAANPEGSTGAATEPRAIALIDTDAGALFTADLTPPQLPGEHRVPVKLSLRNVGPQTWRKDVTRIGYHWYYLDGVEAVWEDETTPLPQDVQPGDSVSDILAWITAPPNDGRYYLVWDLKIGDTWVSTLPSTRSGETLVDSIDIVHGHLTFVDLSKTYNVDGVSNDEDRSDGNLDGTGRTFPGELVPPFANTEVAPNTLWMPTKGVGLDSSRRFAFKWGPKGDKESNFVQCQGQKVAIAPSASKAEAYKAVHVLAAATKDGVSGAFTLNFVDGSQQYTLLPISRWDGPAARGEEIGYEVPRTHVPGGESMDHPAHLFHYVVRIGESKKLASITLPDSPYLRLEAITLEK